MANDYGKGQWVVERNFPTLDTENNTETAHWVIEHTAPEYSGIKHYRDNTDPNVRVSYQVRSIVVPVFNHAENQTGEN